MLPKETTTGHMIIHIHPNGQVLWETAALSQTAISLQVKVHLTIPSAPRTCVALSSIQTWRYGTGAEDDKFPFRGNLTDMQVQQIIDGKQDQHSWAQAKANYFMSTGKKFFMLGHHPELTNFFDPSWASKGFLGGICGHVHTFYPTGTYKGKKMLTLLPGYTAHSSPHGYAQTLVTRQIGMGRSVLVHYDYSKHCFYHEGHSCNGLDNSSTVVV